MSPEARRILRIVLAVVAAVVLCAMSAFSMMFLGLASESLGWLAASALFGLILLGTVWMMKPVHSRRVAIGALVLALLLGLGLWRAVPPSPDRVLRTADSIEIPSTWVQESREERGNIWCFKGCPTVTSSYVTPGDAVADRDALLESLEQQGWTRTSDVNTMPQVKKGRWRVIVDDTTPAAPGNATVRVIVS